MSDTVPDTESKLKLCDGHLLISGGAIPSDADREGQAANEKASK